MAEQPIKMNVNLLGGRSSIFQYAFKGMLEIIPLGWVRIQYGHHSARILSSMGELITCIMSPGKDLEYLQGARTL